MTQSASSGISRKLTILIAALVGLGVLVTAAWFVGARVYQGALDTGRTTLARDGVSIMCADEALGGFPARFELRCSNLDIGQAGNGTLSGGALTTVAPAWNPLLTIIEWSGPFEVDMRNGVRSDIDTQLLRASFRIDTAGALQRLSAVLDPFSIRMDEAPMAIVSAQGLEVHVRPPEEGTGTAADIEGSALVFGLQSPFLTDFETIDFSAGGLLRELALARGTDAASIARDWVARGGAFDALAVRLRLDDHAINLDGDGRIGPGGLLDFDGSISTNDVGALVALMGVNEAGPAAAITAGATLFGRQTTIGEETATELPVTVQAGQISVGPVSLGELPPLAF